MIVTTPDCVSQLSGDVRAVKPGDEITIDGVTIEAVPSYNRDKAFHPKANDWIGFVVTVGGEKDLLLR